MSDAFTAPSQALGAVGIVRVVSRRKGGTPLAPGETVIDVDRSHPVLGNRHVLANHRSAAQRAAVLAAHKEDLQADLTTNGRMAKEIRSLAARVVAGERISLRCWCAPQPCHADEIRAEVLKAAGLDVRQEPPLPTDMSIPSTQLPLALLPAGSEPGERAPSTRTREHS